MSHFWTKNAHLMVAPEGKSQSQKKDLSSGDHEHLYKILWKSIIQSSGPQQLLNGLLWNLVQTSMLSSRWILFATLSSDLPCFTYPVKSLNICWMNWCTIWYTRTCPLKDELQQLQWSPEFPFAVIMRSKSKFVQNLLNFMTKYMQKEWRTHPPQV